MAFVTGQSGREAMAVVSPFEHNVTFLDQSQARAAMLGKPPLIEVIQQLGKSARPYQIISHATDDGRAFNCAYFDDTEVFEAYCSWFAQNALARDGKHHALYQESFEDPSTTPAASDWLWGCGQQLISDTRQEHYQLGMGSRYSRMIFRDEAAKIEASWALLGPEFGVLLKRRPFCPYTRPLTFCRRFGCAEKRLAQGMADAGVEYHGRLVMMDESGEGWLTSSRFGSMQDAIKGTAAVKDLLSPEIERYFSRYETVAGSISSVWTLSPKLPWKQ